MKYLKSLTIDQLQKLPLTPIQYSRAKRVLVDGEKISDLAKHEGVGTPAIYNQLRKVLKASEQREMYQRPKVYEMPKVPENSLSYESNKHFIYRAHGERTWRDFHCEWPGSLNHLAIAMAHDWLERYAREGTFWPVTLALTAGDGKSATHICTIGFPKKPGQIHPVRVK